MHLWTVGGGTTPHSEHKCNPFPYKSHPEPLQGVGKLTPPPQSHVTEEAWGGWYMALSPSGAKGNIPSPGLLFV